MIWSTKYYGRATDENCFVAVGEVRVEPRENRFGKTKEALKHDKRIKWSMVSKAADRSRRDRSEILL